MNEAFYSVFYLIFFFTISTEVVYLQRCLVVTWLVPRETAAVSARSVYTMQPYTMPRHCRFYCSAVPTGGVCYPDSDTTFRLLVNGGMSTAARTLIN